MSLNRREMLRWGALGGASAMLSGAAIAQSTIIRLGRDGVFRPVTAPAPVVAPAPIAGIDPALLARAKAALDSHGGAIRHRDVVGIVDFGLSSADPRFHVVDLAAGRADSYRVAHGRGSDPDHSGYVEKFSNRVGSEASSNGAYATSELYEGKYGLSMRVDGLDGSNSNARERAIVIHNAWYAEPEMIAQHGKLGRSEGCFAFSRRDQWDVMQRLGDGRLIFADKLA